MKKTLTLSILFLLFAFTAKAQWYKLRAYANPFANDSCTITTLPVLPSIAGNGVILYGIETRPKCLIAGGGETVMLSKDDLDTCKSPYSDGGIAASYFFSFASKNDSIHAVIYNNSYYTLITYTTNDFSKVFRLDSLRAGNFPNVLSQSCFSKSFVYSTLQDYFDSGKGFNDTLIIIRSTPTPISNKTYVISKYTNSTNLCFTSDSVGYMVCAYTNDSTKSVLARTADSGKTWTDCFLDSVHVITSCWFPSADTGYITENNGSIYKTINAGATWFKLSSPTTLPLRCVSFANNSLGYIGGDKGALYKTTNGGLSWNTEISGDPNSIVSLYTFGKVAYFKDANNSLYKNESPMGVENIQANALNVDVYPNPSNSGKFTIDITNYELGIPNSVEVYNMLGEKVYSQSAIRNAQFIIDLSGKPTGIYLYHLVSEKGEQVATGKFIIQR